MIDLSTLPLRISNYVRSDSNKTMFKCLSRDGFGCSIRVAEEEAIFGSWKPVGVVVKRVPIRSNEDIVKLLTDVSDLLDCAKETNQ